MKGIIPALLIALAKNPSYLMIELALADKPIVEAVPSKSILSLIEIGIPNRGGKYLFMSH